MNVDLIRLGYFFALGNFIKRPLKPANYFTLNDLTDLKVHNVPLT